MTQREIKRRIKEALKTQGELGLANLFQVVFGEKPSDYSVSGSDCFRYDEAVYELVKSGVVHEVYRRGTLHLTLKPVNSNLGKRG